MFLTNEEKEKLLLYLAGIIAKERKNKGLKLNYPEAVAYICAELMDNVRNGVSYDEAVSIAQSVLKKEDVMDGVEKMVEFIQIELTFDDGTKLLSISNPIK